jgi:capsular exopolysaccharide synthesis family protein
MHSLRRSWAVVLPVALLLGVAAGAVAWLLVPAQYTSSISFRILSRPTLGSLDGDEIFANVQKAQTAYMRSDPILAETIAKSRVTEQYGVTYTPQSLYKSLTPHFNDGPEVLTVMLSGEVPEAVALLLNTLGDVYPAKALARDEMTVKASIEEKEKQLRALAEKLWQAREELNVAEKAAGIYDKDRLSTSLIEAQRHRDETLRALRVADANVADLDGQKAAKEKRIKNPAEPVISDALAEPEAMKSVAFANLMRDIDEVSKKIKQIQDTASEAALPRLLAEPRRQLAALERQRERELEKVKTRLAEREQALAVEKDRRDLLDIEEKLDRARKAREELDKELSRWTREVERFRKGGPDAPPAVLKVRDKVENFKKEQDRVAEQKAGLLALLPVTPRVSRLTEAFVPTEKEYARPLKYALGAFALVFGLSLAGGCLYEARHRKVSASDDVRQGLGLRVIGTIPALPSAARKKSTSALSLGGLDSQFGLTEAVDAVRTTLLHAPHADGARIVMITSATTGEGKTTLASHLAASLARAWRKTLLIDADLRNPNAHSQFDLPNNPGLAEALRGEVEFEDAIKPTLLGRLWMLPAGHMDGHALQALTQDGLAIVFERLKDQFDFIVIDTSPVVPVPDALMLGKHADAVILSVMKDVSSMPAVYAAQQKLEDLGIRVLGAVVIGEKTESYGRPVPYGPVPNT